MNSIAHRDIKPGNIMQLNGNKYCIADYGEGEIYLTINRFQRTAFIKLELG